MDGDSRYDFVGNAFFLVAYTSLIPFQLYLGLKNQTWSFCSSMLAGLILETLGYASRVTISRGTKYTDYHTTSFLCSIIAPTFFIMAISPYLSHVVDTHGRRVSRLRLPMQILASADLLVLFLLCVGSNMATQMVPSTVARGNSILQIGFGVQLAIIVAYAGVATEITHAVRLSKSRRHHVSRDMWALAEAKGLLKSFEAATMAILIRTAYRSAEFSSILPRGMKDNETMFLVMDGAMVLMGATILTICHPGKAFQGGKAKAEKVDGFKVGMGKYQGAEVKDSRVSVKEK